MGTNDMSSDILSPIDAAGAALSEKLFAGGGEVVLCNRFPMLLWWGPDFIQLYNDAYRPMLRDKHPASLAAPGSEVWAEIWDFPGRSFACLPQPRPGR